MHPSVVRRVVYPVYDLIASRHIVRCLRSLERSQWLSAKDLEALQTEKLRRGLTHAATNVPFYQGHLAEAGVRPEAVTATGDLQTIPPIDKATLLAHHDEFIARNVDRRRMRN